MPGDILVKLTVADRDRLKRTAKGFGVPAGTFARDAVLTALDAAAEPGERSVAGMVRALYAEIVVKPARARPPAVAEAVCALVQLGMAEATAEKRVTAHHQADHKTTTQDLITAALRQE